MLYDVNSVESFANAKQYLLGMKQAEQNGFVADHILGELVAEDILLCILFLNFYITLIVIVGNNDDLPQRKVVSTEEAQEFANQMGIPFFETGSTNKNVEELFDSITRKVLIRKRNAKREEKKAKQKETDTMCCRILWYWTNISLLSKLN